MRILRSVAALAAAATLSSVMSCVRRGVDMPVPARCVSDVKDAPVRFVVQQVRRGAPIVSLALNNTETVPVELRKADLPASQRSLLVVALDKTDEVVLQKSYLLETAAPGRIAIQPGSTFRNEIDLAGWFHSIESTLEKHDVVLFWRYDFQSERPRYRCELYGGITLAKK